VRNKIVLKVLHDFNNNNNNNNNNSSNNNNNNNNNIFNSMKVGPCHHGMGRPQVADVGTAFNMEGSCE
jgi:hypothetical protein